MPTDTTIIDRLRAIAAANVCDLLNMSDEAHEPPMITWGEIDEIGRTAAEAADALAAAHAALAECYRLTGADPDGNEDWRLAPYAVAEVKRLREESDAEIAAAHAARDAAYKQQRDAWDRIGELHAQLTTTLRECDEARAALPERVYVVQRGVMDYYGPYLSEFPVYVSRDDAEAAINAPGVRPEDHQIEELQLARAKRLTP